VPQVAHRSTADVRCRQRFDRLSDPGRGECHVGALPSRAGRTRRCHLSSRSSASGVLDALSPARALTEPRFCPGRGVADVSRETGSECEHQSLRQAQRPTVARPGGCSTPEVARPGCGTARMWRGREVAGPGCGAAGSWRGRELARPGRGRARMWHGSEVVRLGGGAAWRWCGLEVVRLGGGAAWRWCGLEVVRPGCGGAGMWCGREVAGPGCGMARMWHGSEVARLGSGAAWRWHGPTCTSQG